MSESCSPFVGIQGLKPVICTPKQDPQPSLSSHAARSMRMQMRTTGTPIPCVISLVRSSEDLQPASTHSLSSSGTSSSLSEGGETAVPLSHLPRPGHAPHSLDMHE